MANILIVDDDTQLLELMNDILAGSGHHLSVAASGSEALARLEAEPVDLVITDIFMPDRGGIDLTMELKSRDPQMKIIAMSGGAGDSANLDYLPIAKLIGADKIVAKPFKISQMRDLVESTLAE